MKRKRHIKILELIRDYDINTQEGLLERLRDCGFEVTQATVSRDIKELKLQKTLGGDGKYKYTAAAKTPSSLKDSFESLFTASVISVDSAGNMIVIKTVSGMAQGVCAAMDGVAMEGTIAGDDTIFVVAKNSEGASDLASRLKRQILSI